MGTITDRTWARTRGAGRRISKEQKSVRFDDQLDANDNDAAEADLEAAPAEKPESRLTREDDDDDDDSIAPRKEGAMAGNDDEADVKTVHGRITNVEGEEDGNLADGYEEGGIKIIPF